ncbi:D-TA family PLP-dependent enzyme [Cyclobacterium jeungdonense]|uniref:D-TA family PLP-dependent enzyme n=1 Tax=Cyclobacterium jeungdonense TaxID=708087 RepID=A0ABT8CDU6_9BACT|nr:D-TA family PLP-dependent enzyme [Cyclobacterium jeungdonense]MDN3689743.1 D-TA family PLP-dependent enzyme [Cyclobacterium jeungdonense]
MTDKWYELRDPEKIDSPALLVYKQRAKENIERAIQEVGSPDRLRPHVKTNKSIEACRLMMDAGIKKFKGATIAEVEMLVLAGANDILLAYQPVGPKIDRLLSLIQKYPEIKFHCLTDHESAAGAMDLKAKEAGSKLSVYIDLNAGTNRTGIAPGPAAMGLFEVLVQKKNLQVRGFHLYDGHLRNPVFEIRKSECDEGFAPIALMREELEKSYGYSLEIIAGGTTTFPIHAARERVTCGPGTFIYWDDGYGFGLPEQEFQRAALVMSRVISLPAENLVCVDLGHKAIASENPIENRVRFLNATDLTPISQSEEHLVLQTSPDHSYRIGDVLYGVPYHICPTVALHQEAVVVENGEQVAVWKTISRDRRIEF